MDLGIVKLTRDHHAPRRAREAVTAWVGYEHAALDVLTLATSELVTNAVKHADNGFERRWLLLHLGRGIDFLRLSVTDPGSALSVPFSIPSQVPMSNAEAENGRGLAIVAELSRGRWGSHLLPQSMHRVVWCHLDIEVT
ncbi:ATP-binding protein [Nonomuraea sp. NPDC052129]|uniref:ATP-binding protein n=1 Tax=Nonomuraea sp. NPDC052129 TaxID=3154651 RepID=UPI00341DB5AC